MALEMSTKGLDEKLKQIYDSAFVKNFSKQIHKKAKGLNSEEVMLYATAAYNVVLCTEFMLQNKRVAEEGNPNYLAMQGQEIGDKLSVTSEELKPETRFKILGLDNLNIAHLAYLLNEKLELATNRSELLLDGYQMRKVKTIKDCTKLVYERSTQLSQKGQVI